MESVTSLLLSIIVALFSGVTILDVVDRIRYRRQNRVIKDADVKEKEIEVQDKALDVQTEEINLADLYKSKMLEQLAQQEELMKKQWELQNLDSKKVLDTLNSVCTRLEHIEKRIEDIEGCLNGKLKQYKKEHHNEQESKKND